MLYPVELRAPEREELICGAGSERQMKLERSEYDGLLIYCLRLRFGNEFLKTWIPTDWVPEWVDL
jgi:hypothetical protein